MPDREAVDVGGIIFEAFPVEYSLIAPAVGYRFATGNRCAVYVLDVAAICDPAVALAGIGIDLYVGNGATATRPMIRRRNGVRIGHAPIRIQLDWCRTHAVKQAVFTHCGSQIVGSDERMLGALVRRFDRERGVEVRIAHDGMELSLDVPTAVSRSNNLQRHVSASTR